MPSIDFNKLNLPEESINTHDTGTDRINKF